MSITLFYMKSNRKNAKMTMTNIVKEFNNSDSILNSINSELEKMLAIRKEFKNKNSIIVKSYISKTCLVSKETVVAKNYTHEQAITLATQKVEFFSIEQFINWLYTVIAFSNDLYGLSLEKVYKDPSIKYFINKFYHEEEL